jgi:hypothetical protein
MDPLTREVIDIFPFLRRGGDLGGFFVSSFIRISFVLDETPLIENML